MIGTIIGDIAGSRFEFANHKSKDFDLLCHECNFTDDSVMSLAIAKAILISGGNLEILGKTAMECMQSIGRNYPDCGYGGNFRMWMFSDDPKPYGSWGNGAAMRVSACGFAANSMDDAKAMARAVTDVTHNSEEGLKGAEAVAVAVYLAKSGSSLLAIRDYIDKNYYKLGFRLDDIRADYKFDESCQGTVPEALEAFFESTDFEDAIRNAVSIGGDSDTIAAITGGVAEAYYGVPTELRKYAITFLDQRLLAILAEFENEFPSNLEKKSDGISVKHHVVGRKLKIEGRGKLMKTYMEKADKDLDELDIKSDETTSQKLFNYLFQACNILRGPINQDEYKSYVTPILFFKRISDVYDEESEDALKRSGGDKEYASFPENHSFIIPKGCHWNDVREQSKDIGKAITAAMNGIERANPDTLGGVFSSFDDANWTDKTQLSDERLKDLIEHMSKIKVGNTNYSSDVMGDAYEYLIKKFADLSKKNAGEFYTPRSIVGMMVSLLAPKAGETIYDPACGTGGMLIESIHQIGNDRMTYGKVYGQEKNLSTSAIARMNLFLHGAKDFKIVQGDTLRNPQLLYGGKLMRFDCVLANPPFSLDSWGADSFETDPYGRNVWGCPNDSCADYAWVQHMYCSMSKSKGRCAVVLPQGALFHKGKDGQIREKLVESGKLECVIALSGGVFYSTGVSACILLLNNNVCEKHKNKVCIIDATSIVTPKRAQKIMEPENVNEVLSLYSAYKDVTAKCHIATLDEIRDNGYILSANAYVEQPSEPLVPIEETKNEYIRACERFAASTKNLKDAIKEGGFQND